MKAGFLLHLFRRARACVRPRVGLFDWTRKVHGSVSSSGARHG